MDKTRPLYLFLDEGGDLNFSPTGSTYFTITSVAVTRPFVMDVPLTELRFDLLESGLDLQKFHAAEDRQAVRDQVFAIIAQHLKSVRVDSVIVDKCKTGPSVREDAQFYPRMLGYLLKYVLDERGLGLQWSDIIVITDRIPINRKRAAIEKAVKTTLQAMLPAGAKYKLLHHESKSCCGLQIADYFNWAIFRAWERGDYRSLTPIIRAVTSQFDIFQNGHTEWYERPKRK